MLLVKTASTVQLTFFQWSFLHFPMTASIDDHFFEAGNWSLKPLKIILFIGTLKEKYDKSAFGLEIFISSTDTFQKVRFCFLLSGPELTVILFHITLRWNYLKFCLMIGMTFNLTCGNVQVRFLLCWFSNSWFCGATGSNSWNKVSVGTSPSTMCSFWYCVLLCVLSLDSFS